MASVLLSASFERCFVFRMRDFFSSQLKKILQTLKKIGLFLLDWKFSENGLCYHGLEQQKIIQYPQVGSH